ncbi:Heterokaryon incompatibility protein (HET) domain containing protein [Rhypophila sp. PSN 637]
MRLVQIQDDGAIVLTQYSAGSIPPYAILSHTWGPDDEEVTFDDMVKGKAAEKRGYDKIVVCRKRAALDDLKHFWVDSCCIDKSSSSELSHAINSMFRWYQNSAKCYVYLTDVTIGSCQEVDELLGCGWEPSFRKSRWFTRGWTLQELVAPSSVQFLSREGQLLGDKVSLERLLHEITGIPVEALRGKPLSDFGRRERMSWARGRSTKVEEDAAYCLLGIFGVNLPLIYGEGVRYAFVRLEEEIARRLTFERRSEEQAPSTKMPPQLSAEEEQCLQSLWFPTMDAHRRNLKSPAKHTCCWIFKHKGYLDWIHDRNRGTHQGLLWLKGNPGTGKSTLMKEAFRRAVADQDTSNTQLAAFFFDAKGCELDRSPVGLYRSLLHHLLPKNHRHLRNFVQLFKEKGPGRNGTNAAVQPWQEKELETFIQTMLSDNANKRTVIFIDALDECGTEVARDQSYFWRRLTWFPGGGRSNISVCISCRHSLPISFAGPINIMLENHNAQDIVTYVDQSFDIGNLVTDPRSKDLKHRLLAKSRGIFLWVVLVVDQILKGWDYGKNMQSLMDELDPVPPGIEGLFLQTLSTIALEDKEPTLRFFQWAVLASQPLRLHEWHHVLALVRYPRLQSLKQWRDSEFFTENDVQLVKQIRILSKGLVNVTSGTADIRREGLETDSACASAGSMNLESGESRMVTVIHQSVREFFLHGPGFALLDSSFYDNPIGRGHARLRAQHQEERHMECEEELESARNKRANEGRVNNQGLSESSSLPKSVATLMDDRSHDGRRHAIPVAKASKRPLVPQSVQDDAAFDSLADLADSDKYFDVAQWLDLLPTDHSVAHRVALDEPSISRHGADPSVTGLSRQLEDYPALLSYATFELFGHARLAEAKAADAAKIINQLQDGHSWSRWVALREDVPHLMKLEDYTAAQGLNSWAKHISKDSERASSPQLNSTPRAKPEPVIDEGSDGLFHCNFAGCNEEIKSFQLRSEWDDAGAADPVPVSSVQVTSGVETITASYYTTLTTTGWVARVTNNSTTLELGTVIIPMEKLPSPSEPAGNPRTSSARFSSTDTSIVTSATGSSPQQTKGTDPPASEDTGSKLASTTIVGISIGVTVAVLILAGLGWMYYIRRRKRRYGQASQLVETLEPKAQLHGDLLVKDKPTQAHEIDPRQLHSPAEMRGDDPGPPGCFELDSSMVYPQPETTTGTATQDTATQPK